MKNEEKKEEFRKTNSNVRKTHQLPVTKTKIKNDLTTKCAKTLAKYRSACPAICSTVQWSEF